MTIQIDRMCTGSTVPSSPLLFSRGIHPCLAQALTAMGYVTGRRLEKQRCEKVGGSPTRMRALRLNSQPLWPSPSTIFELPGGLDATLGLGVVHSRPAYVSWDWRMGSIRLISLLRKYFWELDPRTFLFYIVRFFGVSSNI